MAVFAIHPFALSAAIVDSLGSLASDLAVAPQRDDGDIYPSGTVQNLGGHKCPSCCLVEPGQSQL
jgi:hypothetical protein